LQHDDHCSLTDAVVAFFRKIHKLRIHTICQ